MNEKIYDEQIAPKLLELGQLCQANGMTLVAACEYKHDAVGVTRAISKDSGFEIRLIDAAAQCRGNVDSLILALLRHADKHGSNSIFLNRLGKWLTPNPLSGDAAGESE